MRGLLRNTWLVLLARLVLGALFLYASYDKLGGSQMFADSIENYRLVPRWMINPMAIVLPWVQFIAGVCLLLGVFAPGAGLVSACLYAVFVGALVSALLRGLNIDCGCFTLTGEGERIRWFAVFPRVLGLAASLLVVWSSRNPDWPWSLWACRGERAAEQTLKQ